MGFLKCAGTSCAPERLDSKTVTLQLHCLLYIIFVWTFLSNFWPIEVAQALWLGQSHRVAEAHAEQCQGCITSPKD